MSFFYFFYYFVKAVGYAFIIIISICFEMHKILLGRSVFVFIIP